MKIYEPRYYGEFRCIASACPDSCCKEWDVQVDPDSAARYRALEGPLGDRLRQVLVDRDGQTFMLQERGRCPMWQENGLCRIQSELGEEALCDVCTAFPRLRHDYGDFVELGLELSCPEAARLIFGDSDSDLLVRTADGAGEPEYDEKVMDILLASREKALELIRDPQLPVNHALAVLLLYGYEVQAWIDGGEEAALSPRTMLREAISFRQSANGEEVLSFLKSLEILTDSWRRRLEDPTPHHGWDEDLRKLACYGIQRYWLQAVSDYDIVCRVKLILLLCLTVRLLGGDLAQTAQLMSKEIENDADNVEAILDGAYTAPALTDVKLLGLLLQE